MTARKVLEHLPDPSAALRRMASALRPGGWLLVEDTDMGSFIRVSFPHRQRFERAYAKFVEALSLEGFQPTLGSFSHGQAVESFCGLSPQNASSGDRQADAGLIKAANPALRATLIEAAHRLKRHDPPPIRPRPAGCPVLPRSSTGVPAT